MRPTINPSQICAEAEDLIEHAAGRDDLSNAERFDFVVEAMIDRLDALIVWPPGPVGLVAELADGPILHAVRSLIAIAVQHAFDAWKSKHEDANDFDAAIGDPKALAKAEAKRARKSAKLAKSTAEPAKS